jgi:hypothetical protein
MIIPKVEECTQTEWMKTSAPDRDKSGPLCPGDEKLSPERLERMELLLGKMRETQLQESSRRRRAFKARRRREKRRFQMDASLNQLQQFPADSPRGLQRNRITADIVGKRAEEGSQAPIEDWAPSEETDPGEGWGFATDQKIPEEMGKPEEGEKKGGTDLETIKRRDASRLIRAARRISHELKSMAIEKIDQKKKAKAELKVYRAYVTIEDRVGVIHLQSQVGTRKEFQTTLRKPHEFRKTLIRVFR